MDLSKLPRLSNSEKPPAAAPAPVQPQAQAHAAPVATAPVLDPAAQTAGRSPGGFDNTMDAWLSIAIGLILNLITPRIWQFACSKLFGSQFTWTFNDAAGNPLPYSQTVFFWGDVAFAAFATCMILEGIILITVRKPLTVGIALAMTLTATLFNLGYVAYMMQNGYGFQIFSGLAAAFGVYLAMYEWKLLQSLRE